MRKAAWIPPLLAMAGLLVACGSADESLVVGDEAPDFSLTDTTGSEVSLTEYANGQPVLLYFHMAVG